MRATPSRTSRVVPTSEVSAWARLAASISLRRMSFSSPGRRIESVAMESWSPGAEKCRAVACEIYQNLGSAQGARQLAATPRAQAYEAPQNLALPQAARLVDSHSGDPTPHQPEVARGTDAHRRAARGRRRAA